MQRISGYVEQGNVTVVTTGVQSTTKVEGSFPSATVTVFQTGTSNLVSIFGDNGVTPKANPFTAGSDGSFFFYAANQRVDIQFSGTGIPTPFTIGDVLLNDPAISPVLTPLTVSFSATPTFNLNSASWFLMTLTGNVTAPSFINPQTGLSFYLTLIQDGAGAHTFAWPGTFLNPPVVDPTASSITTYHFGYDGTNYRLLSATGGSLSVNGNVAVTGSTQLVTTSLTGDTTITNGKVIKWSDVGLSRGAAGEIYVGNGTQADFSKGLKFTDLTRANDQGLAVVFADQYASVTAAINALPSGGGTVDARSTNTSLALGTLDPGSDSKPITLLLGPWSYTADHIVLRANFRIIGSAPDNAGGIGTLITSVGANAQPLIVNATSGLINVRGAYIENVNFVALNGNTTQKGLFLDVSGNTTLSVIDNFDMKSVTFASFKGNSIHLKGSLNVAVTANFIQFCNWDRVVVVRPASSGDAFRAEGAVGQFNHNNCRYDGNAKGDGNNIYIGGTSNTDVTFPYSHNFLGCTLQAADTAFTGNGYSNVNFYGCHHENLNGAYLLQATFTNSRNNGFEATGGYFALVGSNAGNGYILKSTTTQVYGALLKQNNFTTSHDKTVNSTNLASVTVKDNLFASSVATAIITTGIDAQMNPAATLNLGNYHTVMLQASGTSVTAIVSMLGPGELITFIANGQCQFATGAGLDLAGNVSPLILNAGDTATFENTDYAGSNVWRLVAYSRGKGTIWVDLTAQGAAIAATTAYAVPSNGQGVYKAEWVATITRAGSVSSTLGGATSFQLKYTDPDDSVVKTTAAPVINSAANTTGTSISGTLVAFCKASTNLQYLFGYTDGGGTTMQYNLHIRFSLL